MRIRRGSVAPTWVLPSSEKKKILLLPLPLDWWWTHGCDAPLDRSINLVPRVRKDGPNDSLCRVFFLSVNLETRNSFSYFFKVFLLFQDTVNKWRRSFCAKRGVGWTLLLHSVKHPPELFLWRIEEEGRGRRGMNKWRNELPKVLLLPILWRLPPLWKTVPVDGLTTRHRKKTFQKPQKVWFIPKNYETNVFPSFF